MTITHRSIKPGRWDYDVALKQVQQLTYKDLFPSLTLEDEREFYTTLRDYGLSEIEVEVLASLYLYGDTYDDIVKSMGWPSMRKLHGVAQMAKAKIKASKGSV